MAERTTNKDRKNLGMGLGLAAAAAAGAYFLYGGDDSAKRRARIRGWMLRARGDVLDRIEPLRDIDREVYYGIVDRVLQRYRKTKNLRAQELETLGRDLKKHWGNIRASFEKNGAHPVRRKKTKTVRASK